MDIEEDENDKQIRKAEEMDFNKQVKKEGSPLKNKKRSPPNEINDKVYHEDEKNIMKIEEEVIKENVTTLASNISNKRVKFNQVVV